MIYIRNKAEALDAVALALALPERCQQIVQVTIHLALCMDAEARYFLADCQAGIIEGGLDRMRERRRELLVAHQQEEPETIVIVDSSENQLLEQVGAALDAMRLSEIVRQLFPTIREKHAAWEIARAFVAAEEEVRQVMIEAIRAHGSGNSAAYEKGRAGMQRHILEVSPPWLAVLPTLKQACDEVSRDAPHLLAVVAIDDMRAQLVIDLLAGSRAGALEYLQEIQRHIDTLHELEAEQEK